MAFVSNQWLNRGENLRRRSYHPVAVGLTVEESYDDWSRENDVIVEIHAKRSTGEYQTLLLSRDDVDMITDLVVGHASKTGKKRQVRNLVASLADADLIGIFSQSLRQRLKR